MLLGLQLFAQTDSSYIYLDDPSGIRPSGSEQIALERAADSLVAAFPETFRSQFKVFEGGIYPVMGYTNNGVA